MKLSITATILSLSASLMAQELKVNDIPASLNKLSTMRVKQALPNLGQIEDALREFKSENPSSKDWNAVLQASLPEVMSLHAKFRDAEDSGRSPASEQGLEDCEYRDRIESLAMWMMKEMSTDVTLRLMSHGMSEQSLASLVYILSRQCEMSVDSCHKDILGQAVESYKANAQKPSAYLVARAHVFGAEQMNSLNDEKSMLADLSFGVPLRSLSSEKPATAVIPRNE